jgi:lactoylglutathione lyase
MRTSSAIAFSGGPNTQSGSNSRRRPETDILVSDVDQAFATFLAAGGHAVQPPFDLAIGRCARLRDPFGNELVILDQTKGKLVTDGEGRVTGVGPLAPR